MWPFKSKTENNSRSKTELYIANLRANTGKSELAKLLVEFSDHFTLKMVKRRYENGNTHRFCIATFDSERLAQKAINKLRKSRLAGHPIEVREYFHRNYNNERRDLNWRQQEWSDDERRGKERRRKEITQNTDDLFDDMPTLLPDEDELEVTGYSDLARKGSHKG